MNKEKIITAESEYGETDLCDGMIMCAFENMHYLDNLDHDILKEIHERTRHYIDVLQYLNDPEDHPEECLEAHGMMEKFKDFNTGLLVIMAVRTEVLLGRG